MFIDNFAGGGGASLGYHMATGLHPSIAINHNERAIAIHSANHIHTHHEVDDIWLVDIKKLVAGRKVQAAWFSPDCRHFSIAKGGQPVSDSVRGLAWIVVRDIKAYQPEVFFLENVKEFLGWGPLVQACDKNGKLLFDGGQPVMKPCGISESETFYKWVNGIQAMGYKLEWRMLQACDYGSPTTRTRLFLVGRRDGRPIVWPGATHGPGLIPYKTAADCIDWDLPTPSVFLTPEEAKEFGVRRPLADKTMKRIFRGTKTFVLENDTPFYVPMKDNSAAHVMRHFGRSVGSPMNEPVGAVTAGGGGKTVLVQTFIVQHYDGFFKGPGKSVEVPLGTVTARDHHSLCTSHIVKLRGTCQHGQKTDQPVPTVTASGTHLAEVRCFILKYYGTNVGLPVTEPLHTVTTKDRFTLVTLNVQDLPLTDEQRYTAWWVARKMEEYCPDGVTPIIPTPRPNAIGISNGIVVDIGMRMFTPRELARAQGFPDDFIIDPVFNGKPLGKTDQIAMIGNSVCPQVAAALITANLRTETVH